MRFIALITGSRDWRDLTAMRAALLDVPDDAIFIHGDCVGADKVARIVLKNRCHEVSVPYSQRHGKAGGPIRNQVMVDMGVAYRTAGYEVKVYAFPMRDSIGTYDLMRRATKAGIEVAVTNG